MQISRNDSNAFLPGTIKRRLLHKNKYLFFFKKKAITVYSLRSAFIHCLHLKSKSSSTEKLLGKYKVYERLIS